MSQQARESGGVACVVVAVGYGPFRLVRSLPRDGYWRLVAVADRGGPVDESPKLGSNGSLNACVEQALRGLEHEWRDAGFVCVVYDGRDPGSSALAEALIDAARGWQRLAIAVPLDDARACLVAPRADFTIQLAAPSAGATESARADALRTILGPFESCWMPHDLESVAATMRELGEASVFATRTRAATSAGHALSVLLADRRFSRAAFVHMTLAPCVPAGLGEMAVALERAGASELTITASLDETFASGEILVGAMAPIVRGGIR